MDQDIQEQVPKKKKKKKKRHIFSTLLSILILLAGAGLLLYPTVSDLWNSYHTSHAIAGYDRIVEQVAEADYTSYLEAAREYNKALLTEPNRYEPTEEMLTWYNSVLNIDGTGQIGYVNIPKINVRLPIYHGTSDSVLQVAVGHVEGSSMPVGGKGTHALLSGHRGLTSAKLFSDLPQLKVGDKFYIHVLKETLTYEVDQIVTILPYELEELEIDPEQDYVTLITCTPYGINTHRLLVRGKRIANEVVQEDPTSSAPPVVVNTEEEEESRFDERWAIVIGGSALTLFLIILILLPRKPKKKKRKKNKEDAKNADMRREEGNFGDFEQ